MKLVRDLSSPWTGNRVELLEKETGERVVRKTYASFSHFARELEAYRVVDESLRPQLLSQSEAERMLEFSYEANITHSVDLDARTVRLMRKLHDQTRRTGTCGLLAGDRTYETWLAYLEEQAAEWVHRLLPIADYRRLYRKLIDWVAVLKPLPVSLVHRDIRPENMAERDGQLLLIDFELAMWGDPYWDLARYVLQYPAAHAVALDAYGGQEQERLDAYVKLYALCFADYLYKVKVFGEEWRHCLDVLAKE